MSVNVSDGFYQAPEYNPEKGIGEIYNWILNQSELRDSIYWQKLWNALSLAHDIHRSETRNLSQSGAPKKPYLIHPIRCVQSGFRNGNIHEDDIIIRLLHDTIESAPHRWQEVLDCVGVDIFLRILKLSKPTREYRVQMYKYFQELPGIPDNTRRYILDLLTTKDQRRKEILDSIEPHKRAYFEKLLSDYEIYLHDKCPSLSDEKRQAELDSLWHYLFFDEGDVINKFVDTKDNLSDVNDMKDGKKEKYIVRRVPKLNALRYILNQFSHHDEITQLNKVWTEIDGCSIDMHGEYYFLELPVEVRSRMDSVYRFNGASFQFAPLTQ